MVVRGTNSLVCTPRFILPTTRENQLTRWSEKAKSHHRNCVREQPSSHCIGTVRMFCLALCFTLKLTHSKAGVFLPQQFRVFHPGGQIFRDLALRSKNGQPSCAVVFGSSTAGGAYHPALSDHTIFVKDQAQVFLGGPPLVKMATGEIAEAEALGGAEMHSTVTGLADQFATDE